VTGSYNYFHFSGGLRAAFCHAIADGAPAACIQPLLVQTASVDPFEFVIWRWF
jgi:hypothetical protein